LGPTIAIATTCCTRFAAINTWKNILTLSRRSSCWEEEEEEEEEKYFEGDLVAITTPFTGLQHITKQTQK
jgi:hypothetical protein